MANEMAPLVRINVALAAIIYESGFLIDEFVTAVAASLRSEGLRVGGVIQDNAASEVCGAMTLVDVITTVRFGISQDLGVCSTGCRLDPRGLAEAGVQLERVLDDDLDLLILNKFGRAESEGGGGLRNAFVRAIERGVPVLTAVRPPYTEAWALFHGGLACALPTDLDQVLAWCRRAAPKRKTGDALATAAN